MNFLYRLFFILLISLGTSFFSSALNSNTGDLTKYENLYLVQGVYSDQKIEGLPTNFKLANRRFTKIVSLSYDSKDKIMRFKPLKKGNATITFLDPKTDNVIKQFNIYVAKSELQRKAHEVEDLLKTVEGVNIKVINDKIVVDGLIVLPSDMNRIASVIKQYPDSVSLVRLSPLAYQKISRRIEQEINNPDVYVKSINGWFIIEGQVATPEEKTKTIELASAFIPDQVVQFAESGPDGARLNVRKRKTVPIIDNLKIKIPPPGPPPPEPKLFQITVHYVELQKDFSKGFRFQWTPTMLTNTEVSAGIGGAITQPIAAIQATISNLIPRLDWAKEHGYARVLQSGSLLVKENVIGKLNSKESIPYQSFSEGQFGSTKTEYLDVSFDLTVQPKLKNPRSDQIDLNLGFVLEQSSGSSAGPSKTGNSISTEVTVRSGHSAAVGGIIKSAHSKGFNRLPTSVPANPLFKLFTSKNFSSGHSEFVVFVTPQVRHSASDNVDKIKKKLRLKR